MEACAHIIVSGMVQGVGFRYYVYHKANGLGINGFVNNLFNGDVEIEVAGERSLIEEFIKDVKVGPRAARVTDLKVNWKESNQHYYNFEIR